MKVLFVSDKVVEHLYSPIVAERYQEVGLIVGCGDLPYYYLEYIVTMLNVPLLYVHGNHDSEQEFLADNTAITGPRGGVNIHRRIERESGLILAGLEGSIRYKPGSFQYTQTEMWFNIMALVPRLVLTRLLYGRYLDVLVAHSPPFGIHNGADRTHIGFKSFLWFMEIFKPRYLIHGHRHVYNPTEATRTDYCQTTVINIYPYKELDVEVSDEQ